MLPGPGTGAGLGPLQSGSPGLTEGDPDPPPPAPPPPPPRGSVPWLGRARSLVPRDGVGIQHYVPWCAGQLAAEACSRGAGLVGPSACREALPLRNKKKDPWSQSPVPARSGKCSPLRKQDCSLSTRALSFAHLQFSGFDHTEVCIRIAEGSSARRDPKQGVLLRCQSGTKCAPVAPEFLSCYVEPVFAQECTRSGPHVCIPAFPLKYCGQAALPPAGSAGSSRSAGSRLGTNISTVPILVRLATERRDAAGLSGTNISTIY